VFSLFPMYSALSFCPCSFILPLLIYSAPAHSFYPCSFILPMLFNSARSVYVCKAEWQISCVVRHLTKKLSLRYFYLMLQFLHVIYLGSSYFYYIA
jgi:hypothetical protein